MIDNQLNSGSYRNTGSNLMYLLIGGGIGATVALLFAPKPGRELRQDVSQGVKYGLETANEKISQVRETAGEKVSHLREVADEYYHKAQDKVSEIYNVALKTADDGTNEAKALVNKVSDQVNNVSNNSPQREEKPMFESGNSFDQRESKTGVL
jgi:gas vesicle protein